jgi:outer membrane protein TolC
MSLRLPAFAAVAAIALGGGCALSPPGAEQQKSAVAQAGRQYQLAPSQRELPELPEKPDWPDVLRRALLANGDLEAAYYQWKAAVARIDAESAWPNTNLAVGYQAAFAGGNLKGWGSASIGSDPAVSLTLPVKSQQAGKVALAEAQAAEQRLRAAKFSLQQKVLTAWLDYALVAERLRVQQDVVALAESSAAWAAQRVAAGGPQQDLLKAQTELELARNEAANLRARQEQTAAMLNGLMARGPREPLSPPAQLPTQRAAAADAGELLVASGNPDLAAMARDWQGRGEALELARLAYIPDFAPQFSIEGNANWAIGTMVMLPTNLVKIRGAIDEAAANQRAADAALRQARADKTALYVGTLVAMRNSQRQAGVLGQVVMPRAQQTAAAARQAYSAGALSFSDMLEAQRMLLSLRLMIAENLIDREKRLAELEALAGLDVETLAGSVPPATAPASGPAPVEHNE